MGERKYKSDFHDSTEEIGGRKRIVPESSGIQGLYADAVYVTDTQGEIILLFGTRKTEEISQEEVAVRFSKQIIMNPFTAKRFTMLLDKNVREYEATYGLLGKEPSPGNAGRVPTPLLDKSNRIVKGKSEDKGGRLIQLVGKLGIHYGFETSFKIFNKTLLGNRFLIGFRKDIVGDDAREKIMDVCTGIGMPGDFQETFYRGLPEANIVLFGYEENEKTSVYKSYLEFGGRFEKVLRDNPQRPAPFIIHLGFKWDASDNGRRTLAKYTCYPSYSVETILERLSEFFYREGHRTPFNISRGIIELASQRMRQDEFLYVEVEEENNPRRSFDINMYRANLLLSELYPWLLKMYQHYAIPPAAFHSLYDPAKSQIFGHLSGGIDREERDFLTVYFGVKGSSR